MGKEKRLVLIDGHAMLYRAYFGFPKTLTRRDGTLINAAYGFTRILLTVIGELSPKYLAVSFDIGKTFRHEMYPEYKAHREKMPDELKNQEPIVDQVLNALNIPVIAKEGYEADDVIGTLARQASELKAQNSNLKTITKNPKTEMNLETIIVTGDKDVLQVVCDPSASFGSVQVYMPARINKPAVIYDEKKVKEDLGVAPEQIPDYKGLAGDSSDNIPGVRGVGPKTAVLLLGQFGSIERLYQNLATSDKQQATGLKLKLIEKLVGEREMAIKSKELATIIRDVPIKLDLSMAEVKTFDKTKVVTLFEELEFRSLINKLPKDEFEEEVQEALF